MPIRDQIKNYPFAVDFSGTNGGIIIPNSPSLNMTDFFAAEKKVYVIPGKAQTLIDNSQTGATFSYYLAIGVDGSMIFYSTIGGVSRNLINVAAPVKPYAWNDYAVSYDGAKITLFANGRIVTTLACTGSLGVNSGVLRINQYWSGAFDLQGLDCLTRIYHTNTFVLKDHQRTVNNKDPRSTLLSTAVLNLDYSAGTGTSVPDLSSSANHGVFARAIWSTNTPSKARVVAPARNVPDRVTPPARNTINDPEDISIIYKLLDIRVDLNPELVSGVSDGVVLSTLPDGSGYGRDAISSGSLRPTFYNSTPAELLNGHPTIKFNGANQMQIASGIPSNPGVTIIIIGKSNSGSASNYFADGFLFNRRVIYRASSQIRIYAGNNVFGGIMPNAAYGIITGMFNSTGSSVGYNYLDAPGDCGLISDTGLTIGNSSGAGAGVGLDGSIARVIVANGVNYSNDVLTQVRLALSSYYNI